jgi:hypothetical protein
VSDFTPEGMARVRRETIRWFILVALDVSRPAGCYTEVLLSVVQGTWPDATHLEVRREVDYLEDLGLLEVRRDPTDRWYAEPTANGVDVAQYAVDCPPGIKRPKFTRGG